MADLTTLSNNELIALAHREFLECDQMMTDHCEGSPDALKFGWDWPTFHSIFPEQYDKYTAIITEGRKRGLGKKEPS